MRGKLRYRKSRVRRLLTRLRPLGVALAATLLSAAATIAATTISSNIQTDGTLSASGRATTSASLVVGSTQPGPFSLGAGDLYVGAEATTSGNLGLGQGSGSDDDSLYFDINSSEFFSWLDSASEFSLSDDLRVSGNATVTANLQVTGYASTTNLVLADGASNLATLNDLYVSSGNLFYNTTQLGAGESGGPGSWQATFGATALTPTSTTRGFFVNASSTVAGPFRVDGSATTTGNLTVQTGAVLGDAQPRSTTTAVLQDAWAFGDSTTSAIFIAAPTSTAPLTGLGPNSAYYALYAQDNPQLATTTYALYADGGQIAQTAGQVKHKGAITDDAVTVLNGASYFAVQGHYAYVAAASGDGIEILDLSSPTGTPVHVGALSDDTTWTTELDGATGIAVQGRYAYVAAQVDDGVEILDISDPTRPRHVGSITDDTTTELNGAYGISVQGRYAYVVGNADSGVEVLDISDPANPRHVGAINDDSTTLLSFATGITVLGRYAYVAAGASTEDGVEVLDISDPANPRHVAKISDDGTTALNGAYQIVIEGKYAYVAASTDGGVEILDISDPSNPRHVGAILDGGDAELGGAQAVAIAGRYAYVAGQTDDGVEVLDISVPTNPRPVAAINDDTTTELDGAWDIKVVGKYVYITANADNGFEVLEISGLDVPAANIGSLAVSTLDVWQDVTVAGHLSVGSGLNVTGATMLSGAFSVGSSTTGLLHVDPVNDGVFIATSTAAQTLTTWSNQALVVGGHTLLYGNTTTTGSLVLGSLLGNDDDYLFFDNGWLEALWWDDSPGQFQLTDNLVVNGNATTTNNQVIGTAITSGTTTVTFGPTTGGGANGSGNGVCLKLWQSGGWVYCIPDATNGLKCSANSCE